MNLRDMLERMDEASPMAYDNPETQNKPAIVPNQTNLAKTSAKASAKRQNEFNHSEFLQWMIQTHPKFSFEKLGQPGILLQKQNEFLNAKNSDRVNAKLKQKRTLSGFIPDSNESVEEQDLNEYTSATEIDDNLIRLMMDGDPTLAQKAKMALRNIEDNKGVNKTFSGAIKKLLSHLTDILADGGVAGYKVIDNLHKSMAPEKHAKDEEEALARKQSQMSKEPEVEQEPTDKEISDYAKATNTNIVTAQQKQDVIDRIKADKKSKQMQNPDTGKEPEGEEMELSASKQYEEPREELKRLSGMIEAMSDAYGEDQVVAPVEIKSDDKVEGSVEFKQHKNTDKGSVSIEASGDDMQELAKVLKMAGLTLPQDMYKDEPESHDDEPEDSQPKLDVVAVEPEQDTPCGSDEDPSYSTDKEVLVNYIKDKLKKSIT